MFWLVDNDQDALYATRDYCRAEILAGCDSVEKCAAWMKEQYTQRFTLLHNLTLTDAQWQELTESCLADTSEIMGYEEKNDLPLEA